jgi:hypothetical protein
VANVYATLGNFTNFSTANALITGGSVTGITGAASFLVATNFSTANALITGGSVTGITGAASFLVATNFSSANAEITGSASHIGTDTAGAVSRVANVYATLGNFTNFSTANALITGGTINLAAGNITAGNIFITTTSIQNYEYNAVTTKSYVDTMLVIFGT